MIAFFPSPRKFFSHAGLAPEIIGVGVYLLVREDKIRLFGIYGFTVSNKGKTSGSRIIFVNGENSYIAHKPHPGSIVKGYVMKQVLTFLKELDLL